MSDFNERPNQEPDDSLDQLLSDGEWPQSDPEIVRRLRQHWSSLRFDQLLHEAEWTEPDADTVNRLRRHFSSVQVVNRRRIWRRKIVIRIAACAAVLVLAVASWWLLRPDSDTARQIAPLDRGPGPEQIADDAGGDDLETPDSETVPGDDIIADSRMSRPATPYELLLVRSIERRSQPVLVDSQPTIDSQIAGYLADPDADAGTFIASLTIEHATCEQKLLELSRTAPFEQQLRIIGLLEHVGSDQCISRLIELTHSQPFRGDAIRALTVLADVETIAELAWRESDEASRQQYLSELLSRQSEESLGTYLDLMMNGATRDSALAVLDDQTMPPVELLFRFMEGPDYSRRSAAAIVLGRLDAPDVTERLILLTRSHINRQEALIGLLVSSDEQASRFLSIASRDQTMFAAVNSAQLQLQYLTSPQWRNTP